MNGSGSRSRYLSSKGSGRPENRAYFPFVHPDTFYPDKWPEHRKHMRPGVGPYVPYEPPTPNATPAKGRDRPAGSRGGPNKPGVRPRPPRNPDAPRSPRPSVPRPPRKRKK